ncbi:MAG: outer membrane lipoprotein-sorting protein, partial [Deltaproteobacteria bacterium]|nr:outer membrane lipoprotein-sorting protein [Deltaproteobacteria bacterium]
MNQNKSILSAICLTICLLWLNPLSAEELSGYDISYKAEELNGFDIIYKAEEKENGSTQISDSTMILINAKGQKRIRRMKVYRKDFGETLKDERSITFFLSPADIKNTTYLSYDYDDGDKDDDSWLYLPSLKKVKRLASFDKSDAFPGSDFTYTAIASSKRHFWNYT